MHIAVVFIPQGLAIRAAERLSGARWIAGLFATVCISWLIPTEKASAQSAREIQRAETQRTVFIVEPTTLPIQIDGVLDDAAWEEATRVKAPVQ